jgi:DNA processing protein
VAPQKFEFFYSCKTIGQVGYSAHRLATRCSWTLPSHGSRWRSRLAGSRLSASVLKRFGSPDGVFRASPRDLESCQESLKRAEKELPGVREIAGCALLNWTEPEYPRTLFEIYDPPVPLYVRGDPQVLNLPSLSIVGT